MREFMDGAEAIARGALAAGCNFFAGYPITPATPILLRMLRELPKVGGVGIQGEDEIASIGVCTGFSAHGPFALDRVKRVIVPELNLGQYRLEVERIAHTLDPRPLVIGVNRIDGELIHPD